MKYIYKKVIELIESIIIIFYPSGINFSKCFLAAAIFICIIDPGVLCPLLSSPVKTTIIYVLAVKKSIYVEKLLFCT